jgi:hypothetical protein
MRATATQEYSFSGVRTKLAQTASAITQPYFCLLRCRVCKLKLPPSPARPQAGFPVRLAAISSQGIAEGAMAKRRSPKLVQGQYSASAPDQNLTLKNARLRLLDTIRRIYPTLLKALTAEVLPTYSHLAQKTLLCSDCLFESGCPARTTEEVELKSVFSKWADKFNISSAWLRDEAIRALYGWHENAESLATLEWFPLTCSR